MTEWKAEMRPEWQDCPSCNGCNNLHRDLPSLDRACNFVARQLGLLEER